MRVLFYRTASGRKPVEEFILCLPRNLQLKFYDAIELLSKGELLKLPINRNLGNVHKGLNELRLRDRTGAYRIFYYLKTQEAILFTSWF